MAIQRTPAFSPDGLLHAVLDALPAQVRCTIDESLPEAAVEVTRCVEAVDVLVTDVALGGQSGAELAKALLWSQPSVKVVYCSGYTREHLDEKAFAAGTAFLQEPFSDVLHDAIERLLA